jgi:hypothetical protein
MESVPSKSNFGGPVPNLEVLQWSGLTIYGGMVVIQRPQHSPTAPRALGGTLSMVSSAEATTRELSVPFELPRS